jgi:nitrite reductase (NADH) large subunit
MATGGTKNPAMTGSVTSTKLKVSGIDLCSPPGTSPAVTVRGHRHARCDARHLQARDRQGRQDPGRRGALWRYRDGNWYFDLLKKGEDISDIREALIFGQAFASGGATADPIAAVAALSDDAEICGCNGVSKGKVWRCIAGGAQPRCGALHLQGFGKLRQLHRLGRKPAAIDAGRRIRGERGAKTDVQMHQLHP